MLTVNSMIQGMNYREITDKILTSMYICYLEHATHCIKIRIGDIGMTEMVRA